jgi:hypothetical protein
VKLHTNVENWSSKYSSSFKVLFNAVTKAKPIFAPKKKMQNLYELSWEAITGQKKKEEMIGARGGRRSGYTRKRGGRTVSPSPRKFAHRWRKTVTEVESFRAKAL